MPVKTPKVKAKPAPKSQKWDDIVAAIDIEELSSAFTDIVGDGDASRILAWLRLDAESRPTDLVLEANADDKEVRIRFHDTVREHFKGTFSSRGEFRTDAAEPGKAEPASSSSSSSSSSSAASSSSASASSGAGAGSHPQDRRRRLVLSTKKDAHQVRRSGPMWPRGRPPWTEFTLFKVDHDTIHAVQALRRVLRGSGNVVYAGTKDRRAATSQRMAVWKLEPNRLAHINRALPGIRVGDVAFVEDEAQPTMGRLEGNRFTVVLRQARPLGYKPLRQAPMEGSGEEVQADGGPSSGAGGEVKHSPDLDRVQSGIETSLQAWKTTGYRFINYYGMQRFGSGPVGTHVIGQCLLSRGAQDVYTLMLRLPGWVKLLENMGQSAAGRLRAKGIEASSDDKGAGDGAAKGSAGAASGSTATGCKSLADLRKLWPWLQQATDKANGKSSTDKPA